MVLFLSLNIPRQSKNVASAVPFGLMLRFSRCPSHDGFVFVLWAALDCFFVYTISITNVFEIHFDGTVFLAVSSNKTFHSLGFSQRSSIFSLG